MVDQREGQDHVRVGPLEEGTALAARPAESRARVCEIEDERQDVGPAFLAQRAVVLLGRSRVDVEGEYPLAGVGGDPAVAAGVRAQIPCPRTGNLPDECLDEPRLVGGGCVAVAGVVRVVRPLGAGRRPVESLDRRPQVADQGHQALPRDTRPPGGLALVGVAGMAAL